MNYDDDYDHNECEGIPKKKECDGYDEHMPNKNVESRYNQSCM